MYVFTLFAVLKHISEYVCICAYAVNVYVAV